MRSRPHMLAVEQSFSPEWVHRFSARSAACSFLVRDRSTEYWTLQGMCNKQWFCNIMLGQSCLGRRQEAPPWPLGLLLAYSHLCKPFFWAAHEFPSFALYPSSLPHTAIFQLHVNCLHFLFLPWTNFLKAFKPPRSADHFGSLSSCVSPPGASVTSPCLGQAGPLRQQALSRQL